MPRGRGHGRRRRLSGRQKELGVEFERAGPAAATASIRDMGSLLEECIVDPAARARIAATIADVLSNIVDHTRFTNRCSRCWTGSRHCVAAFGSADPDVRRGYLHGVDAGLDRISRHAATRPRCPLRKPNPRRRDDDLVAAHGPQQVPPAPPMSVIVANRVKS